jgi:hypothetical protein
MIKTFSLFVILLCSTLSMAAGCDTGDTLRALFIGNSYTYVNDLPGVLVSMGASTGDVIQTASSTPGGYTLQMHSSNTVTLSAIAAGVWDYVVLQEQSQLPALQDSIVAEEVFPFAHYLDSLIIQANQCTETVFYRTWGRKNGDTENCPTWPPVCTYQGMDSLLHLRYRIMTDSFSAIMSPVGMLFRYLRMNQPNLELYDGDGSHPSPAGTYAAACSFYTVMLRKDPALISFDNGLDPADAANIRNAAKTVVFDNLMVWNVGKYDPTSAFITDISGLTVNFTNQSTQSHDYFWDFGDGNFSTEMHPVHMYAGPGTFHVTLISYACKLADTTETDIHLDINSVQNNQTNGNQTRIICKPGFLEIFCSQTPSSISLFGTDGRQLIEYRPGMKELHISTKQLSRGLYIIKIQFQSTHCEAFKISIH